MNRVDRARAALTARVAGIGAWAPGLDGWPALRAALVDETPGSPTSGPRRPSPALLPAAERRRMPDGVAVALAVAAEAMADGATCAEPRPAGIATVFASAHGELAIVDYLCETLATDPLLLSPTRFHHSVHNAAAGYWSIATGDHAPSTSIAAGEHSFALGLVEAVIQVVAEGRPVLFVAFDTPAVGLLSHTVANDTLFGTALLLVPAPDDDGTTITLAFDDAPGVPAPPTSLSALAASSAAARALALLEVLATGREAAVRYPTGPRSALSVTVRGRLEVTRRPTPS